MCKANTAKQYRSEDRRSKIMTSAEERLRDLYRDHDTLWEKVMRDRSENKGRHEGGRRWGELFTEEFSNLR